MNTCKANDGLCKTCQQSACNSRTSFAHCNVDNVHINEKITSYGTKTCKDYNDQCFIHIEKDTVKRGCLQEYLEANSLSKNSLQNRLGIAMYRTCNTPMCNDEEIETEFCINCSSETDPNCKANVTSKMRKKCNLAKELMGCYHYEDLENDLVIRGCVTELDETESKMDQSNTELMRKCFGNECNSKATLQRCMANVPINDLEPYSMKVCSDYNDECYTHVANNVIRKGCFGETKELSIDGVDIREDCKDEDICRKCKDNLCNNYPIEKEYCMHCDSKDQALCAKAPQPNMKVQCSLAVKPLGCFLYKDETQSVRRGCLSDEPSQQRKLCREEGKFC